MAKTLITELVPARGYTKEDWDEVVETEAEASDEELATARPFAEVFPDWAAEIERDRLHRAEAPPQPDEP